MMNTKRSYVLLGITTLLSLSLLVWNFSLHRHNDHIEKALYRQQDSLTNLTMLKTSLQRLMLKYGSSIEENSDNGQLLNNLQKLIGKDTAINSSLFKQNNLLTKQKIELTKKLRLQEQIAETLTERIAHLEDSVNLAERQLNIDKNQLRKYVSQTDSLRGELRNIVRNLNKNRLDTLRFTSPKNLEVFYYGKVSEHKPEGFGIGFYKEKGYYIGEWSKNMRHGKGKHYYLNGDVYEGEFVNDLRSGFGRYFYASGERYEGHWDYDLMNGQGKIFFKNKTIKNGIWVNGKLKETTQ
ncbi:MAG: MORN repeat-containing protein [Runella sp.]